MAFEGSPGETGGKSGGVLAAITRGIRVRGGIGGRGATRTLTAAQQRRVRQSITSIRRRKSIERF